MTLAEITGESVSWITILLFIADGLIRIGLSLRVVMHRRGVGESLSWLAIILLLPFVGAAIYLILGENRLGRTRLRRLNKLHPEYLDFLGQLGKDTDIAWSDLPEFCQALDRQAYRVSGIPTLPDNRLTLLNQANLALRQVIRDIESAKHTCHMEFYIWFEGGTADEVAKAVIAAAERGVECRVLLDAMGSKHFLKSDLAWHMRDAGVYLVECLPVGIFRALFRRIDLRNHRKIIVIDGRVGFTGSLNMIDPRYFKRHMGVGGWVDAMVRVEGPAVKPLAATFLEDWELETGEDLLHFRDTAEAYLKLDLKPKLGTPEGNPDEDSHAAVQVVPSGPHLSAQSIHHLMLTAIYNAKDRLILTSPYFVPDESLLIALASAAARGVNTTVILPERNDSVMVRYASRAYYQELLESGVKIAKFQNGLLHTKSVTVDQHLTIFGTVNLDMRSFYLNFELSMLVYDEDFTRRVRLLQQSYLEHCTNIDLRVWENRPFKYRLIENSMRLLGPLL